MLIFSASQIAVLARDFRKQDEDGLAHRVVASLPDSAESGDDRLERALAALNRFGGIGFRSRSALFTLAALEVAFGPRIEDRDPEGQIALLLSASEGVEEERAAEIASRLRALLSAEDGA